MGRSFAESAMARQRVSQVLLVPVSVRVVFVSFDVFLQSPEAYKGKTAIVAVQRFAQAVPDEKMLLQSGFVWER